MSQSVARWAPLVRKVAKHQHSQIKPSMLLALIEHESGGQKNAVNSSSGAFGLTQFLPSTAGSYGVKPGHARSQIRGAVKYLNALNYKANPTDALDHHYGGAGADGYHAALVGLSKKYRFADKGWRHGGPTTGGGRQGSSSSPGRRRAGHRTVSSLSRVPGTDNSAVRQAVLQQFALSGAHDTNSLLQLATDLKDAKDVPGSSSSSSRTYGVNAGRTNGTRKGKGIKAPVSGGVHGQGFYFKHPGQATKLHGTTMFEGTRIAAWIKPALVYARRHGWKGSISSGFRSYADQKRIYDSGVRPAAVPGTSNHEGANFPRGAVDVSDASSLGSILLRSPYRHLLQYAGSKDPVHFSHPHNGGY